MSNTIKAIISAAFAALTVYVGRLLVPLAVLIAVMIIDYGTGMVKAWITSNLSSKIGLKGIVKKVSYLLVIAVAMVCDWLIGYGLSAAGLDSVAPAFVCILVTIWFIINECISILENLGEIGVPLPGFLLKMIKRLKGNVERGAEVELELTDEEDAEFDYVDLDYKEDNDDNES